MQEFSLNHLDHPDFTSALLQTPSVDHFCSSADWIVPAYQAFGHDLPLYLRQSENGFAVFLKGKNNSGQSFLHALDVVWGFACPLIGSDTLALLEETILDAPKNVDFLCLSGIDIHSPIISNIKNIYFGDFITRCVIDLSKGTAAYLNKRSKNFKHALHQAENRALKNNVVFEDASGQQVDVLFDRLLKIEQQSWKGEANDGLITTSMQIFYRLMMERLHAKKQLKILFAKIGEEDIGYLLGGLFHQSYRGLQFSYNKQYAALSIGNLLQWQQMRHLEREEILFYDMGMEMPYKHRFADSYFTTQTLILSLK